MDTSPHIKMEKSSPEITIVQINRLEKKNALTNEMYSVLNETLKAAQADDSVRVVILRGHPKCFTAGNDLGDFLNTPPTGHDSPVFQYLKTLAEFGKPIVIAAGGPAVGIGTTMMMHCDLTYATPTTRFQLPFVKLGLCPEAASSLLFPRLAGYHRAAEVLLLGEPFDADFAREIGLINEIVPEDRLFDHALAKAEKLAALPPESVQLTKSLMKQSLTPAILDTMAREGEAFIQRLHSPEAKAAFETFFSK
jgi:enoyl-CoA hydratase/carnithine racemase